MRLSNDTPIHRGPTGTSGPENPQEPQDSSHGKGEEVLLRKVFKWTTLILTTTGCVFIWLYLAYIALQPDSWLIPIRQQHFAALFGIPVATMIALAVVILLSITAGPIEFEAFGQFKLLGAAGEVLFWVICFLAITLSFWLLW
jgi:FtsH-binding integral membrane protein